MDYPPHFDGQSVRRLIFEDDFDIICQDKVAAEVNILAERKEKQYVSDNAQLMEEWNYARNVAAGIEPWEITYGSAKKVWWKCAEGHEWEAAPNHRSRGRQCPVCARQTRATSHSQNWLASKGSLAVLNPTLASQWHPTKNGRQLCICR